MSNVKKDSVQPRKKRPEAQVKPKINLIRILWRYPGLILSCTLLAAGLGYVVFSSRPPTYQASAKVFVTRRMPSLPFDSAATSAMLSSALEQMLFTHAQLIQNEIVLREAAKDPVLNGVGFPSTPEAKLEKLKEGASVGRPRINNQVIPGFLEIVFTSSVASEPVPAVRAVTTAYSEYLRQSEMKEINEAVKLISKASESLDHDVLKMQQSYNEFLVRNQLSLRDARGEILNVEVEHLREAELKLLKLKERHRDYKQKIKTLEAAASAKQEVTPAALAYLIRREGMLGDADATGSEDRMSRSEAQARLLNLRLKERELLDRLGPDHPTIKTLREQMSLLIPLAAPNAKTVAEAKAKDPNTLIQEYLESLRIDLAVLVDQIAETEAVVIKERPRLEAFSKLQLEERQLRDAITGKKSLFDAAVKRLEELRISREDNSTRALVVSEPNLVDASKMTLWRFLFGGAVLGFAIGLGLSVLREMTMNCFRTPDEIHEDLGVHALAHIPPMTHSLRVPRKGVGGSVVTLTKPRSRHAESFRALRTNLFFLYDEPHQVLQITSPVPREGKTTVAVNLAVSISQSGKSVLLIDADMRRPKVAEILNVPDGPGLSDVLRDKVELEAAISRLDLAPGLDILAAGEPVANPSELLTQPQFPALLDRLRREYDYVVIDSPPILAVSDPAVIAPRADGVLVVLRIRRNSRDLANRCLTLLNTVKAPLIGVVANTFLRDGSDLDYGYGQYVYGGGKYSMFTYNGYRRAAEISK